MTVSSRTPDAVRPTVRAALPFRIVDGAAGKEMEFEEMITHRFTGQPLTLTTRVGGNNAISWARLKEPLFVLMQMYRELERHNDELAGENDRLRIEISARENQLYEAGVKSDTKATKRKAL